MGQRGKEQAEQYHLHNIYCTNIVLVPVATDPNLLKLRKKVIDVDRKENRRKYTTLANAIAWLWRISQSER